MVQNLNPKQGQFLFPYKYKIKMSRKQISQKVIDFQYSRINAPVETQKPSQQDYDKYQDRYTQWNLMATLRELKLREEDYTLYWVGYGEGRLIEAFIYCLLAGFRFNVEIDNSKFAKTKYSLYQICEKYLSLPQQKQLVENLCYSQYTKNMSNYLNKNPMLEQLIGKIFRSHIESFKQYLSPIEELKLFSLNFTFLAFEIVNESVAMVKNFNQKYYIVKEKECVFVVEVGVAGEKDREQMKSSLRSNQKGSVNENENSIRQSQKNIQCSTPKFLFPNHQSYKVSTQRQREKQRTSSEIQMTEVTSFEDKQRSFLKANKQKDYHLAQKYPKQSKTSKKEHKNKKSPNFSLRNTIDMHIANLQKYELRAKMNRQRRPKGSFFKDNSKDKDKVKAVINDSFASILKSKSSEVRHISPSPETSSRTNSFFVTNRSSYNVFPSRNNFSNAENSQLRSKPVVSPPRVSFTYYSP